MVRQHRIFNSWNACFDVMYDKETHEYGVALSGAPFNDAYRYVDWLLTVPLLLIELILVMGLSAEETSSKSWNLGVASALMVALGYPGEIQDNASGRWLWWCLAMVPFCYVVATLVVGLEEATAKMPPTVASLVRSARWLTVISWLTYPVVYMSQLEATDNHLFFRTSAVLPQKPDLRRHVCIPKYIVWGAFFSSLKRSCGMPFMRP